MRTRHLCRYLTAFCLVAAILGIVVAGTGTSARAASGRLSTAHRPGTSRLSAVGNYTYVDTLNNNEELNVNEDGTVLFSSGCSGLWVQSGKAFSTDVNANLRRLNVDLHRRPHQTRNLVGGNTRNILLAFFR